MTEAYRYLPDSLSSKKKFLAEELAPIADILESRRFNPVPFHNQYFQTIAGITGLVPPFFVERKKAFVTKREIVEVAEDAEIALDYSLHEEPEKHSTVVVIPGFTGSGRSPFSVGIANKAVHCGFNAVRVTLRGANDSGLSSKTLSHAGLSEDIKMALKEINNEGLTREIYIAAVSFGGNMVLKAVGEMGQEAQGKIGGVGLVSSIVDTRNGWEITRWLYKCLALGTLKNAVKRQAKADPENWKTSLLGHIKTIKKWDSTFQVGDGSTRWGFKTVEDYYERASALPYIGYISVPTLAIHAQDDPIVPALHLRNDQIVENPNIITVFTDHGGHGGFVNFGGIGKDLDGHWGQNRVVEFFRLLEEKP